ncbi:uncharacterized protein BDR25DRAFT_98841 [Lindgomyces ingoldianus]|uniref:Uncharacterized protein n=1 Tax=Lindgomyces ingoldianus TaxID=673940 RepID=A0ACB6QB34_9PLEO|nr:uncharacterized protein BDR25DRAFT_98841 [Lindgomyces ingoldianus]KAF2464179.1 hypothetical protein BDR25DRAFT_98841 [Lindgomyces ingoldianus]
MRHVLHYQYLQARLQPHHQPPTCNAHSNHPPLHHYTIPYTRTTRRQIRVTRNRRRCAKCCITRSCRTPARLHWSIARPCCQIPNLKLAACVSLGLISHKLAKLV